MMIQVFIVINAFFFSVVQFVSRTGKTTDFTKIKGWRDKFAGSGSLTEGKLFSQFLIFSVQEYTP